MKADFILQTLNDSHVDYLLIGGMNFLFRHRPVLTYDIDVWIDDTAENRARCEAALAALEAEWGTSDDDWQPVARRKPGWLARQGVFSLVSPYGSIDVFRSVRGLEDWRACRARAVTARTSAGVAYMGLSDQDMLQCQLALPEQQQRTERIEILRRAIENADDG